MAKPLSAWRLYAMTPSAKKRLAATRKYVTRYAAEYHLTLPDALNELVEYAYDASQSKKQKTNQEKES